MDKDAFNELFLRIIREAIQQTQVIFARDIPAKFLVELHGAGISYEIMPHQKALDLLYIDDKTFYPIIDVGVKYIKDDTTVLFVRVSAYKLGDFNKTWNSPAGNGPFKVIVPLKLEQHD